MIEKESRINVLADRVKFQHRCHRIIRTERWGLCGFLRPLLMGQLSSWHLCIII